MIKTSSSSGDFRVATLQPESVYALSPQPHGLQPELPCQHVNFIGVWRCQNYTSGVHESEPGSSFEDDIL